METMKKVAARHGMACLLHEKPFAGVNGSGKHNNWSMCTDKGENLLDPGSTPEDNAQFLLFLSAVIKAVDDYQDLLRLCVASAGNDHRLGANEAPPAIVSMYLGEELDGILSAIAEDRPYSKRAKCEVEVGVKVLPHFPKDSTDRNRTSPFAFTGNKFEFRMLGSTFSISGPNIVLNTIVADSLDKFADRLDAAKGDIMDEVTAIIKDTFLKHRRIIFNGNNYSDEWVKEAERRGLLNLRTTPEAMPLFKSKKNIDLFVRHGVFTEEEVVTRTEIMLDNYCKVLHIESMTMQEMIIRDVIPAVNKYIGDLSRSITDAIKACPAANMTAQSDMVNKLSSLVAEAYKQTGNLKAATDKTEKVEGVEKKSMTYKDKVIPIMEKVRACADSMEQLTAAEYWPMPTYGEILFSINE